MSDTSGNGNSAGNRQINANTGVTIGLVLAVVTASAAAIYKAGEVITDLGYVKLNVSEVRADVAEMKRIIQRLDRQQGSAIGK